MKVYDLIVIGAGPAGALAAQLACKHGLATLVLERGRALKDRRDPACGWFGHGLNAMSRLEADEVDGADEALELCREANDGKVENRQCDEETHESRHFLSGRWHELRPSTGRELAIRLYRSIAPSADLLFETEVRKVMRADEGFIVQANRGRFAAKRCLIAVGSKSAEWIVKIGKALGLDLKDPPVRFGVRVEMPARMMRPLLSDRGSIRIEHAGVLSDDAWPNGFVSEWEDFKLISAFGYRPAGKRSERTSFMLSVGTSEGVDEALRVARILNVLSNDKLRRERAFDLVQGRSVMQHFAQFNSIVEGLMDWRCLVPRFIESATVHVPELRIGGVLPADDSMRTTCPGLYGAGQCVSQVKTLLGAMASGLTAARSIIEDKE